MLQLDPFLLFHLAEGRIEQVGLGFVALGLAGVVHAWSSPGRSGVLRAGGALALVTLVGWEHVVFCALAVPALVLALVVGRPCPGAWRRLAGVAGLTLALAGPWVALFLARTLAVRSGQEATFGAALAARAAVSAWGWLAASHTRPGALLLLALVAVPWVTRERRAWLLIWAGLLCALVLALGPAPRLAGPPRAEALARAPFALLQRLPVLGMFHWPDRLLAAWSLAAAPAVALVAARLGRRWGTVLAVVTLASVLHRDLDSGLWPRGGFSLPVTAGLRALRDDPLPGAVLDLPIRGREAPGSRYLLEQLTHGRPTRTHAWHDHLLPAGEGRADPVLARLARVGDDRAAVVESGDASHLRALGFSHLVLHGDYLPRARAGAVRAAFVAVLGQPTFAEGVGWLCWRLDGPALGEGGEAR